MDGCIAEIKIQLIDDVTLWHDFRHKLWKTPWGFERWWVWCAVELWGCWACHTLRRGWIGCHTDQRNSSTWKKNKHTREQVNVTKDCLKLTRSYDLEVVDWALSHGTDMSNKRTGGAAQPPTANSFLNKQTESKFQGTFEAPAHDVFGCLLLFHVNSFEESFCFHRVRARTCTPCCWLTAA